MSRNFKKLFKMETYAKIIGTGSYIPEVVVKNEDFLNNIFFETYGKRLEKDNEEVIKKLYQITGIKERRYAREDQTNSMIATEAAKRAIEDSGIDPETLDYIIFAHNYGDVKFGDRHSDFVPSLATRVKHALGIKNPWCVGYDVAFGCPGWVEGMIQAGYFIKSGDAKKILVIGSETLSRISDPHDRDSMIFGDGAGAVVLEAVESEEPTGIIGHLARTDAAEEAYYLYNGHSFNPDFEGDNFFIKMLGHKVYEYALTYVPDLIKRLLDKLNLHIDDVQKILIHQANEKMDIAIGQRVYKLYGKKMPESAMPVTITNLGNSSVGTIPTMLDMIMKGKLENHSINPGDIVIFASVGAGMNINALVYKF